MKKLHFYKNRKLDSQKDKYKNLTSNHYYGYDPKGLSIHMNPESVRAKESNKLINMEKVRMKTEEINHSIFRWTQDILVFIQEKENIRKRKGSDATFEHIMKISRMNEQIKWLRSELNKTS